jgi:hypothetical protein
MRLASAITFPAKAMTASERKKLALQAISKQKSLSDVANDNQVSRKFIYYQKNKMLDAINQVFNDDKVSSNDEVLFHLPVTNNRLKQFVTSLVFDARSCFRGVIKSMKNLLDWDISIGGVYNIVQALIPKAKSINTKQDLSKIKLCAQDEMFQHNKPVLTGVDIRSLYCFLLSQEDHRDGDTWAIHLLDLQKQQFNPERVIADYGNGLRAGHAIAFPNTPCDADHFHITQSLMDLRRFFRNKLKRAISYRISIEDKILKAMLKGHRNKHLEKYELSEQHEKEVRYLSESIDTLVSWVAHDIFNMAGPKPSVRRELFDFVVSEFKKLEKIHPHRIRSVRITMKNQRDLLLGYADVLNRKFITIAKQYCLSLTTIWKMCELQRCKQGGDHYAIRSLSLQFELDKKYDEVEDAVIAAMNSTERTSSLVENLNSRLSPYFFLRREIGNGYLDLLKFYLNHTPFMRSENQERVGKSPAEILKNSPHDHWLSLLGFKQFKRKA